MPTTPMPLPHPRVLVAALLLLCAAPLQAQREDRIWGRVFTGDGEIHEGFIHLVLPRGGAGWTDVFAASKEIPDEHYQDWLDATRGGEPHLGTIELKGYRITWEQTHPSFEGRQRSGIRFGHLAGFSIDEEGDLQVLVRSNRGIRLEPGDSVAAGGQVSATIGTDGARARVARGIHFQSSWNNVELRVEDQGRSIEVRGRDVERIEFAAAPAGSAPPSARLYGTVEDRDGRSFTGFVTWDRWKVLNSQSLTQLWEDVPELANPWESDKYERSFHFSEIRSIERTPCFGKVTLQSDTVMELCVVPFDRDPWPVRISDPALGLVEVEWDAVRFLRFEPAPPLAAYDAFDGGRPLSGTVVTREGEEITGRIRWDADEEWSWELLQGSSDDVDFSIEFGKITHIQREEPEGARVTLQDGRSFHLTGGNDVDRDNRGIFVFPAPADGAAADPSVPEWRYVAWEDFREVRFHPTGDTGAGS